MTAEMQKRLDGLSAFLCSHPSVRSAALYGSLAEGREDMYSDIDLALDVSGTDNGQFLLTLPAYLQEKYPVLYMDFAPSLAQEKYILTAAVYPEEPFLLLDISVIAEPHFRTVTKEMLSSRNDLYSHTLKVFSANLKHYLRGMDCAADIRKMFGRLPGLPETDSPAGMLLETHRWLSQNGTPVLRTYAERFTPFLPSAL